MNEKKAKLLRRTAGFRPNAEREYNSKVRKVDKDGNPVAYQIFCTGPRAIYNSMKKGA